MIGSPTTVQHAPDNAVRQPQPKKAHVDITKYAQVLASLVDIAAIAGLVLGYGVMDRMRIDGAHIEMIGLFTLMNTQYSDDYSHASFRRIRRGDTEQEVLDLLGEPLMRIGPYGVHPCGSTECPPEGSNLSLVYSMPPNLRNTNYRSRIVVLESGVVTEVKGRFHAD